LILPKYNSKLTEYGQLRGTDVYTDQKLSVGFHVCDRRNYIEAGEANCLFLISLLFYVDLGEEERGKREGRGEKREGLPSLERRSGLRKGFEGLALLHGAFFCSLFHSSPSSVIR